MTIISDEFLAASGWEKKVTKHVKAARHVLVSQPLMRFRYFVFAS
jgi:hypothetical protein